MSLNYKYNPTFAIMKGFAIFSVVLGHCAPFDFIEKFVNQYHLAVFFFVAGYFFKEKYLDNPHVFFWKKIKSLYLPYIAYCLTFLLLHNVFYKINLYAESLTVSEIVSGG